MKMLCHYSPAAVVDCIQATVDFLPLQFVNLQFEILFSYNSLRPCAPCPRM